MGKLNEIKERFEKAVNEYAAAFQERFDLNAADCWWINDEVGLDLFCFGDGNAISLGDMVYVLTHNVSAEEYYKYVDYDIKCHEHRLQSMNLRSWCMGAPRIPQEVFDRIEALEKQILDICKQYPNEEPF